MRIPNFFIVGAPKCGTTAMNDYLNQHPDIFMATKELHFFGSDLQMKNRISQSLYLNHFESASGEKIIGEASVWYLFSETAAKEIKAFSPDAQVLIMLRNPVDVIHSLHAQHLYDGNEDIADFETALALDHERKQGHYLPKSVDFFRVPSYKDSVLFSKQVERYLKVFGKENVHIVLYDDFAQNTKNLVQEVFRFLGVDSAFTIKYEPINQNKEVRAFWLHRFMKHPSQTVKKAIRVILPVRRLRHFIMTILFKLNIRIRKRKAMQPGLRALLKKMFSKDIQSLSELIERELSMWLK